jgi:hypothetical protein
VFSAPYYDISCFRDALAYNMSAQMGRWTPSYKLFELFIFTSGEIPWNSPTEIVDGYKGIYILLEAIRRERIGISKINSSVTELPELSGTPSLNSLLKRERN